LSLIAWGRFQPTVFFARENREKCLETLMINHAAKRAKVCKLQFRSQFFLGDALRKGSVPTEPQGFKIAEISEN